MLQAAWVKNYFGTESYSTVEIYQQYVCVCIIVTLDSDAMCAVGPVNAPSNLWIVTSQCTLKSVDWLFTTMRCGHQLSFYYTLWGNDTANSSVSNFLLHELFMFDVQNSYIEQ